MKKLALDNPKAIAAVLVRRKWWLLVSAALAVFATFWIAIVLPPIYVSDTLIRIKGKEVPDTFVPDLVSMETDQRLSAIQQTILSRKVLLQIINNNESLRDMAGLNQEDKIASLRDRIGIEFERPDRRAPATHFRISFQSRSPQQAQTITQKLALEFIKEDTRTRTEHVDGTEEFFSEQVQNLVDELRAEEEALSQWKRRYQHELPQQLESNLRTLDRLQDERTANAEALDRALSLKMTLERQISETPPMIESTVTSSASPGNAREVSPLVEEYREKERYLASLTHSEIHPDVVRTKAALERLRKQIPPEDLRKIEAPEVSSQVIFNPNPVYQSLVAQLDEVKTDIEIRKREKEGIERDIRRYETYVANTPQREQEQAERQRRYDELQQQFVEMNRKLGGAELAGSLEDRQKGEQFRIVDEASLPLRPAKPNRRLIVLLGCLASLALGAAVAIGRDLLDQTFWTYQEVEEFFGVPILIEIPQILSPLEQAAKRRWAWAAPALFTVLILAGTAALLWIYRTPEIRTWSGQHLDILARLTS